MMTLTDPSCESYLTQPTFVLICTLDLEQRSCPVAIPQMITVQNLICVLFMTNPGFLGKFLESTDKITFSLPPTNTVD